MSSKTWTLFVLTLFLSVQNIFAQTYSLTSLPQNTQKLLKDFAFVESHIFTKGVFIGRDSLQFHLPVIQNVNSFYISRFEVTVGQFLEFGKATGRVEDQPDTSIWMREFPYSYNRPIASQYFVSSKYRNHPVVSVSWEQAVRYCRWKSEVVNEELKNTGYLVEFRLPTEAEWELAALAQIEKKPGDTQNHRLFPWNGGFMKSTRGGLQLQCNSGPLEAAQEGFYLFYHGEDNYLYTAPVQSYQPNEYGLYQMAGNVAEWTSDHYSIDTNALRNANRAYPDPPKPPLLFPKFPLHQYDDYMIVKGGSWVDQPYYTQCGVRKIQHPKQGSATIGFRPVCVVRKREQ